MSITQSQEHLLTVLLRNNEEDMAEDKQSDAYEDSLSQPRPLLAGFVLQPRPLLSGL